MKRIYVVIFILLVTGFVRGDASVTREQDPLTVNAKTIALKLENPRVRVLEATLKPGDKEQTHSHPAYVIYVIAGGKFRNHATDGTVTDGEFKTGDVNLSRACHPLGRKHRQHDDSVGAGGAKELRCWPDRITGFSR